MRMRKRGRRPRVLRPPSKPSPHETWEFVFQKPVPKEFDRYLRVWTLRGASEADLNEAILIAAMQTKVPDEQKPLYMGGIIKNMLRAREQEALT